MSYELDRIEELCRERGWSHYRLAIMTGTSPNNIGNLFRRTTVPSIPTIRRICEAMGITMAQFFSKEEGNEEIPLNKQQKHFLSLFCQLDGKNRVLAEAYIQGLLDGSKDNCEDSGK